MINYPEDFKNKCKEVYPHWPDLHMALDSGSEFVGRYLDDASCGGIEIDTILDASSLEGLKDKARYIKIKRSLYNEWWDIYHKELAKRSSKI